MPYVRNANVKAITARSLGDVRHSNTTLYSDCKQLERIDNASAARTARTAMQDCVVVQDKRWASTMALTLWLTDGAHAPEPPELSLSGRNLWPPLQDLNT